MRAPQAAQGAGQRRAQPAPFIAVPPPVPPQQNMVDSHLGAQEPNLQGADRLLHQANQLSKHKEHSVQRLVPPTYSLTYIAKPNLCTYTKIQVTTSIVASPSGPLPH